jgi:(5-formylfuran-3-yl)methyl phosphate synthase
MQLLVSVRSAAEVQPALSGGADIIDAKEPSRGSLGAVSPEKLIQILDRIPPHVGLSIALGDLTTPHEVFRAITSLPHFARRAPTYLKLGFAGVSSAERVRALLATARAASQRQMVSPHIIAVGYADAEAAGTINPELVSRAAASAGAAGVLLDTHLKDGRHLLSWMELAVLTALLAQARAAGLLTAVAGGLEPKHLRAVSAARPDVVGFRGAACVGGRGGQVSRQRVLQLQRALRSMNSGFVQEALRTRGVGETPEAPAISGLSAELNH